MTRRLQIKDFGEEDRGWYICEGSTLNSSDRKEIWIDYVKPTGKTKVEEEEKILESKISSSESSSSSSLYDYQRDDSSGIEQKLNKIKSSLSVNSPISDEVISRSDNSLSPKQRFTPPHNRIGPRRKCKRCKLPEYRINDIKNS